jgi:hypothetical protein
MVETLEERTVMASPASLTQTLGQQLSSILPIVVNNVVQQTADGVTQLVAQGTIAGHPFTAPLSFSASPAAATPGSTPILHLHLGPINLNLLGLQVKTSEICLNIDAQPGPGNLLGNLLSGLTGVLNGGGTLGGFLGGLSTGDLSTLTGGLTDLLNGGLGAVTSSPNATVARHTTNILHLEVGPLHLDLLGLVVNLDNCAGGPVTVDVNAISGSGNLLGNLLSTIAHLTDRNPNIPAIDHLLAEVGGILAGLGL